MTNVGGSILSTLSEGYNYPYSRLDGDAHEIYHKNHPNTYTNIFQAQIDQNQYSKRFVKRNEEYATVLYGQQRDGYNNRNGHPNYGEGPYNTQESPVRGSNRGNPQQGNQKKYGYDSVDDLQQKMSEPNPESKVKKDVFSFYGIHPPPTGTSEREKIDLQAFNNRVASPQKQEYRLELDGKDNRLVKNNRQFWGCPPTRNQASEKENTEVFYQKPITPAPAEWERQKKNWLESKPRPQLRPQQIDINDPTYMANANEFYGSPDHRDAELENSWAQIDPRFKLSNRAEQYPPEYYKVQGRHEAHKKLDMDYDLPNQIKYSTTAQQYGGENPSLY